MQRCRELNWKVLVSEGWKREFLEFGLAKSLLTYHLPATYRYLGRRYPEHIRMRYLTCWVGYLSGTTEISTQAST